jgi:hypothetical protein
MKLRLCNSDINLRRQAQRLTKTSLTTRAQQKFSPTADTAQTKKLRQPNRKIRQCSSNKKLRKPSAEQKKNNASSTKHFVNISLHFPHRRSNKKNYKRPTGNSDRQRNFNKKLRMMHDKR